MDSWEPVDIDHDGIGKEYDKWENDVMNGLEIRLNQLRQYNKTLDESRNEDLIYMTTTTKNVLNKQTTELVVDQIYDKITKLLNERRSLGIKGGADIINPIRDYEAFDIDENGNSTFIYKNEVIGLGNVEGGLLSPSKMIRKLGVKRLESLGFINIDDEDVQPSRKKHVEKREKLRKLDENLDKTSKKIEYSSTTGAEAIEMIEITSKDMDTTVKDIDIYIYPSLNLMTKTSYYHSENWRDWISNSER